VGRESSVRALEEALNGERKIFSPPARRPHRRTTADEIYQVGTVGNIVQSVRMPDGNIKVLVEGIERARAVEINDSDGFFRRDGEGGQAAAGDHAAGRAAGAARHFPV